MPKYRDFELGRFKVIQGQRSWCQSIVYVPIDSPWAVSYSTSIDPIVVSVTVFEIFSVILMTLNQEDSRSSKVKGRGPNREPIGGLLSDFHCVQRRFSHRIRDI